MKSLLLVLLLISSTVYSQDILISRKKAERCLEIKDSLNIYKSIVINQKEVIHNGQEIILRKDIVIEKQKSDSTEFTKVINKKDELLKNKNKEIQVLEDKNKDDNNNHRKKEVVLLIALALSLLL